MTGRYGTQDAALREARAKAIDSLTVVFRENWGTARERLLDALEAIDQAHAVAVLGPGAAPIADLTEQELAELRERLEHVRTGRPKVIDDPAKPSPRRRTRT